MITPLNNSIISPNTQTRVPAENAPDDSSRRILGQRREPNSLNTTQNVVPNATSVQRTSDSNNLTLNSAPQFGTQSSVESSSVNRGNQLDITA